MIKSVWALVLGATLPVLTSSAAPNSTGAVIAPWGLDLTSRDPVTRPGTDFYRFANGRWLKRTTIPEDQASWGVFSELNLAAQKNVQTIIQSLPSSAAPGSSEQKIGDFYRTYLDTDTIDKAGLAPVQAVLDAIDAAKDSKAIASLMGRPELGLFCPLGVGISLDQKDPDRYVVTVGQSGLGLPQRDYYLEATGRLVEIRAQYVVHLAKMLRLAGEAQDRATSEANAILTLETQMARVHWPVEKLRERELTYNLRSYDELVALAPSFPWSALLAAGGIDREKNYVVEELDAVAALGKLFASVPLSTWKSYLKVHFFDSKADVLPHAFDEESFDFFGRKMRGQVTRQARWKRAVDATSDALGEEIGRMYVARYFSPDAKAQVLELVENLRSAYAERIRTAVWMSASTKVLALEKLAAFHLKIAYPDHWRDYSSLMVRSGDAFGNAVRAGAFAYEYDLKRLHQPTDRDEWGMTPQTVNAYYNPMFNEVVFPAAILQPPFFDPNADTAVNYGGIGSVIGHEMSHGFDDQGAKSDAKGILRSWWKAEDEHAFKLIGDQLAGQYGRFNALPGVNLNGRLTLGENLGDLGGLTVAYEAYRLSLQNKTPAVLDGLSGDQRFFLSWAQVWRTLQRDEALRTQVLNNPHAPARFRVNGVVRNMDAWYAAFHILPSDLLYVPPGERVRVW